MLKANYFLFDLDGTLLDTGDLIHSSFEYTFQKVLGQKVPWEQIHQFWGRPLLDQMKMFSVDKAEEMLAVYREHNAQHHDQLAQVTPGASAVLAALKEAGKVIGVVTSKSTPMAWRGLRLFDLDQYIDTLVGAEDTSQHKPNPDPLMLALEKLRGAPAQAVMVGDSPYDIEAGLSAGTYTVGLDWTIFPRTSFSGREPHLWIESLTDLIES